MEEVRPRRPGAALTHARIRARTRDAQAIASTLTRARKHIGSVGRSAVGRVPFARRKDAPLPLPSRPSRPCRALCSTLSYC